MAITSSGFELLPDYNPGDLIINANDLIVLVRIQEPDGLMFSARPGITGGFLFGHQNGFGNDWQSSKVST